VYLAAHKTKCHFKKDEEQCRGTPVLKCLRRHNNIMLPSYFIGCSNWRNQEKFHHFINIKENVDLDLLQQLLDGSYEIKKFINKI
ncbi:656_t:CDS:1, partial [Gigaspora rosea]